MSFLIAWWQVTVSLFLIVVSLFYLVHWFGSYFHRRRQLLARIEQLEFWQCLHREAHRRLSQASLRRDVKIINAAIRECNLYHRRFCEFSGREPSIIPTVPE